MNMLRKAKWWFYYRFHPHHRYHMVNTGLPYGNHECDERMLYACFAILKEYVENQAAWMALICNDEELAKVPWWMSYERYARVHNKRLAINYLTYWEGISELEAYTTSCIEPETLRDIRRKDRETKELYLWWTETRPSRTNPYKDCYEYGEDYIKAITSNENLSTAFDQEMANDKEDEDMLIRLMKIRQTLWT